MVPILTLFRGLAAADGPEKAEDAGEGLQPMRAELVGRDVVLRGRRGPGAAGALRLELREWGRGTALEEAGPGAAAVREGGEVRVVREGITEWFLPGPRTLQHGFTVERRPAGPGNGAASLCLAIAVSDGWTARVLDGGRDARFTRIGEDGEEHVHYAGLRAWGADRREIAASMVATADRLLVLVDDAGAPYPLIVDPWMWIQTGHLVASDAAPQDYFGHATAVDGDTAVIGAYGDDNAGGSDAGAAYVFRRAGSVWCEESKLTATPAGAYDGFGHSVALDGDSILAGADGDDSSRGCAYVFVRSGSTWAQQAMFRGAHVRPGDRFGWSVSLDGDTALVGAVFGDDVGANAGTAYVFVRSGSTWAEQAKLTASDGSADDRFGTAVFLSGTTAVVGARNHDHSGAIDAGAAYVFVRTGTVWSQQAKLTAADAAAYDHLGLSIAADGDTACVGAFYDDASGIDAGSVYVFARSGAVWSQQARLEPSAPGSYNHFGSSVFLRAGTALIGATGEDGSAGAAYEFRRDGSAWVENARIQAADAAPGDFFGQAIAFDGQTLVVGADYDDGWSGSAYTFEWGAGAAATHRNSGANPDSYTAVTLPVLGSTYTGTIDLGGTTGHSMAWLVGYATGLTLPLGGGQVLLVNVGDPAGELLGQGPRIGPVVAYDLPVPADPALSGAGVATQALHFGTWKPFALSNAQDLFLGR
ncbi:MAG: FG-GAP repeat protein [Planctomycetota bacterium]